MKKKQITVKKKTFLCVKFCCCKCNIYGAGDKWQSASAGICTLLVLPQLVYINFFVPFALAVAHQKLTCKHI